MSEPSSNQLGKLPVGQDGLLAQRRKYNPLDGVVELIASAERYDKSRHGAVDATRVMTHVLDVAVEVKFSPPRPK